MGGFVLLLLLGGFVVGVNGQIGVTNCDPANDLCGVYLTNAECEAATTSCICLTGYVEVTPPDPPVACTYECGALAAPANGAVDTTAGTTTDAVATFSCDSTYKLSGASESTCVADTGWDNTATTCVPVEIGDSCATNIFACGNIANAQCQTFTSCECLAGYEDDGTGLACSEIDECAPAPCQNGATCVDALGSYSCTCVAGYTDTDCETGIDECAGNPCQNGGTCTDGVNMYTCSCVAGYNGDDCENNINECSPDPCQNGATCIDGINAYSCSCVAGYTDTNCQTNIDECDSDPCQNGATCVDGVNQYTCNCVAGYNGDECQTNIDECIGNICVNGATCVDGINQYTCNCVAGYNGDFCETNIDECATHACQNGADCVDGINTYSCVCPSGYTGQFCNENIDECDPDPCINGGTCVDEVNDYTCNCVTGYTDKTCATNIDDCAVNPCQNGATCLDAVNDYSCVCVAGYTDKNCDTNIDECDSHICQNGALCLDGVNGYTCVCSAGYTGTFCLDDIDECDGNQCQNGAICIDGIDGYTCDCVDGYDGTFCQNNINECASHACLNGATCVDGINEYTCSCVDGYTGEFCATDINECNSNTCVNGATCVDGIFQYTCDCVTGYTGTFCETNIDECDPDPCQNWATCVDGVNDYTCNCVTGYTDKNCQTNIDECDPDPCMNGATCVDNVNDYTCNCVAGYDGKNCGTNIDECDSDPCQNGGTCVDGINEYTCNCVAGYNGDECQTNIDECVGNLCENGATCVDGINVYTCDCVPGYDGTYCGNNIDECLSHSCLNGATCVDEINAYSCICVSGYTDQYCQTDINECASNPCDNDGTCTDLVNGYVCTCANGFTGLTCRAGELGDDCSTRAEVCANLANAECDGSVCVCETGYEDPTGATGTCSRRDCGTISPPVSGAVDHAEGTLYEDKAYFSCDTGYTLTGVSSVTCQNDATWDGATPTCIIKDCGSLATPLNGALQYTPNTEYQGLAEFSCDTGYTLTGDATRTCLDSGVWGGDNPTCQINDCGSVTAPTNGNVDATDGTTYGSVIVFQCDNGYDLAGATSLECQADSSWDSARPTCNIKDCGFLTDPTNGVVDHTQGTTYLAEAVFSCNTGYELIGSSSRICQASGLWSGTGDPYCQIKDCGVLSNPDDGDVDITDRSHYNVVATYSCDAGFELNGVQQRTCQADGLWSTAAPTCDRLDCGNLQAPTYGSVDLSAGTLFAATATFSCDTGYTLTGDTQRYCTNNGVWDNTNPTCIIKDCGTLTDPANGQVLTVFGTTYAQTADYSCVSGYQVNGVSTRTCLYNGLWSASDPTCVILDCGPVADIVNGGISYSSGTIYGSTVFYSCGDGYEVTGASSRVCLADGSWSASQPTCTILDCDAPTSVSNAVARTPSGSQVGDIAIYECISGYGLVGDSNVTCEVSGFWGTVPECRLVLVDYNGECAVTAQCVTASSTCRDDGAGADRCLCSLTGQHYDSTIDTCLADCGPVADIVNGGVRYSSGTIYGSTVYYTCDNGYEVIGKSSRVCQASGMWSGTQPVCAVFGGGLGDDCSTRAEVCGGIANAECNGTTCVCMLGFGESAVDTGICNRLDCGAITPPVNGTVDLDTESTVYESKAYFSCNVGYTLTGVSSVTCQANGTWDGVTPTCVIKDCGIVTTPLHGAVQYTPNTEYLGLAEFSCKTGYFLIGDVSRICQQTGEWGGCNPICLSDRQAIITCAGDIDSRGTVWADAVAGEIKTKMCNEGFRGDMKRECGSDGKWKLPVYDCVREAVKNIQMAVERLDINSTADTIAIAIADTVIVTSSTDITNGELDVLTSSLKKLATILSSALVTNKTISDGFIGSIDNLIDDTNDEIWKSETDSNSAEECLSAVDNFSEALSASLKQDEKHIITRSNIALKAQLITRDGMIFPDPDVSENVNHDWIDRTRNSIQLQPQSLSKPSRFVKSMVAMSSLGLLKTTPLNFSGVTEPYMATAVIYRNLSGILPNRFSEINKSVSMEEDAVEKDVRINGPVLAMTVSSSDSQKLNSPLRITFEHYDMSMTAPICVFWQYQSNSEGFWSSDGCRVKSTNTSFTVCECDHLTNFAVLMSPFKEVDISTMTLRIISIVGILISILCLIVTFVIHFCLWKYLRSKRTTLLINLCIALLVAYIVFLAGINRTESKAICTAIAAFLHYIYLVVFCIMLVEGLQIALAVLYVFKTKIKVKLLLIIAWGLPAVIVGISLIETKLDGYGNKQVCWLSSENGLIWSFVGPAAFTIIFNSVCICLVIRAVCRLKVMEAKPATDKVKASIRSLCVLIPLLGISWIVGLFYIDDRYVFVQYIFAILNALQGFFIFLFHCLLNNQVKKAIGMWQKRKSSKETRLKSTLRSTLNEDSTQKALKGVTDSGHYTRESNSEILRETCSPSEYPFTAPFGYRDFTRRAANVSAESLDNLGHSAIGSSRMQEDPYIGRSGRFFLTQL